MRGRGIRASLVAAALVGCAPAPVAAGTNVWTSNGPACIGTECSRGPVATIRWLALDPVSPGTIYAAGGNALFKSVDAGSTWTVVLSGEFFVRVVALDPRAPSIVFTGGPGVFKSVDGGATWSEHRTGLSGLPLNQLAVDPSNGATIYAGTNGDGIYKSVDGGLTWRRASDGLPAGSLVEALVVDPRQPGTVYAALGVNGLFKSANGGSTWTRLEGFGAVAFALAIDPMLTSTLYLGGAGVWKTTDGGSSWRPVNAGLPTNAIMSLTVDAANPNVVYVGTGFGVYQSPDGAESWHPFNEGFTGGGSVCIVVAPSGLSLHAAAVGVFDRDIVTLRNPVVEIGRPRSPMVVPPRN